MVANELIDEDDYDDDSALQIDIEHEKMMDQKELVIQSLIDQINKDMPNMHPSCEMAMLLTKIEEGVWFGDEEEPSVDEIMRAADGKRGVMRDKLVKACGL